MDSNIIAGFIQGFFGIFAAVIGALIGAWASGPRQPSGPSPKISIPTGSRKRFGIALWAVVVVGIACAVLGWFVTRNFIFAPVPESRSIRATIGTPNGDEYELQTEPTKPIQIPNCYGWQPKITVIAVPDNSLKKCCDDSRVHWILQQNGSKQEGLAFGTNNKADASFLTYSGTIPLEAILTKENVQIIELELVIEVHARGRGWVDFSTKPQKATIQCTYQGG